MKNNKTNFFYKFTLLSYGYRGELRDAYAVIRSLFEIHNEVKRMEWI